MTDRADIEDVLGRVRRFEKELSSIGVNVKVDVRGLDADTHEHGVHDSGTCALCAAYERGFGEGRSRGSRERSDRFEALMNRLLDRS